MEEKINVEIVTYLLIKLLLFLRYKNNFHFFSLWDRRTIFYIYCWSEINSYWYHCVRSLLHFIFISSTFTLWHIRQMLYFSKEIKYISTWRMSKNIINLQLQLNSTLAGNFKFHKESAIALRFKICDMYANWNSSY